MNNLRTVAAMLDSCEARYKQLIEEGCDESIAVDRTWDAYECAFGRSESHCADPRDRLFENKLRTIMERGKDA